MDCYLAEKKKKPRDMVFIKTIVLRTEQMN